MSFEQCLARGKIKEFSQEKALVQKELQTAEKDLLDGREGFERGKYKWTTIQSYYVMFHSARALLYNKNYRERSHYCLIVALRHLYVSTGKLPGYFIESLQKGRFVLGRGEEKCCAGFIFLNTALNLYRNFRGHLLPRR